MLIAAFPAILNGPYLLQSLQNEWMPQCLCRCASLLRIKRQASIQEIREERQLLGFGICQTLGRRHQAGTEISGRFDEGKGLDGVLF